MQLANSPSTRRRKRVLSNSDSNSDGSPDSQQREDSISPALKRYKSVAGIAEVETRPDNDLASKREAAVLKLKSVWDSIIEKYSAPEVGDYGDVIDLETGDIIEDNGHLRSLAAPRENVWGQRKSAPRKGSGNDSFKASQTMFTSIMELESEEEDEVINIDSDSNPDSDSDSDANANSDLDSYSVVDENSRGDEERGQNGGKALSTFNLNDPGVETPGSPQVPDIRVQMSQKLKKLQQLERAKTARAINYDTSLLSLRTEAEAAGPTRVKEDRPFRERTLEDQFLAFFIQDPEPNQNQLAGFFYHADAAASLLKRMS